MGSECPLALAYMLHLYKSYKSHILEENLENLEV